MTLVSHIRQRHVLVTGKGGVGKTTVTAALARAHAGQGKRVLAAEISYQALEETSAGTSPLAAALGVEPLTDEPRATRVPGLFATRLSPLEGHRRFLRDTLPMRLLADTALRSAAVRRFFAAAPTLAELGVVYRLLELVAGWDMVICDLPATGHTLALAQVPQALVEVLRGGPIHAAAQEGLALLRDGTRTTTLLVTLPEPLPVSEAVELHEGLRRLSIDCALAVLNRVPVNPFLPEERAAIHALAGDVTRTLGARRLPRIDRATAAQERLAREVRLPVVVVHEAVRAQAPAAVVTQVLAQLES